MKILFYILILILLQHKVVFADQSEKQIVGVNLSGAEYGGGLKEKAKHGFHYIWPTPEEIKRFADKGFTVIRVPFLWERFQPKPKIQLENSEAIYLDKILMAAEEAHIKIILDPHNFGNYYGQLIGSAAVPIDDFKDFWSKVAFRYKRFPNVIFGLMNEPHKHTSSEWAKIAQAGVDAIRETGANQLILVPGTHWSAVHNWTKGSPSNAEALINIHDPVNNFAYEMHFYLDSDSSGTHKECVSEDIGTKRLKDTTQWLKVNNRKAFLGEFGVSDNELCLKALDNTLAFLKSNADVWSGWTYWSASKWGGKYMYDIYSLDANKQKQFSVIKPYLNLH